MLLNVVKRGKDNLKKPHTRSEHTFNSTGEQQAVCTLPGSEYRQLLQLSSTAKTPGGVMLTLSYQRKISFTQTCTGSVPHILCVLPKNIYTKCLISHFLVTIHQSP